MTFGRKIRQLREARPLSRRDRAGKVRVSFTYILKIEKGDLDFGNYPSQERRQAVNLFGDDLHSGRRRSSSLCSKS